MEYLHFDVTFYMLHHVKNMLHHVKNMSMSIFDKFPHSLKQDEPSEVEQTVDPRFQAVLHAELIDFFMHYDLMNYRLRWLLDNYQFKDFDDMKRYFDDYVVPLVKENKDADTKNLPG